MKDYLKINIEQIVSQISAEVNKHELPAVITHFEHHFKSNSGAVRFEKFYFKTIQNQDYYLKSQGFFREFKQQYSLQGIDLDYLSTLESSKENILELLLSHRAAEVYLNFFAKAKVKHGKEFRVKNLGSFYAKTVHTFMPEEYCALDNPIKNHLGLKHESFFVAHYIISEAYKTWAIENQDLIGHLKSEIQKHEWSQVIEFNKLTDLKILDVIFWEKANNK